MNLKTNLIVLLLAMTLISSWRICGAEESISSDTVIIETDIDVRGLKKFNECVQRLPILEKLVEKQTETISKLEESLANMKELLVLERQKNEINQKMLEIKDREIAGLNKNFDQMKEIADRAIKLAEVSKPKSNWQLYGLAAIVGYVINELVHR